MHLACQQRGPPLLLTQKGLMSAFFHGFMKKSQCAEKSCHFGTCYHFDSARESQLRQAAPLVLRRRRRDYTAHFAFLAEPPGPSTFEDFFRCSLF
jgi:hypothetical protein